MSQDHHDKDRREFIRQSLGVAPLMLTLGGRSHGGKTSMHGTLWSSLGTKWKHKKGWWGWKDRRWHWSKKSGDEYRDRDRHDRRDYKDYKQKDELQPARKDWDWDKSDERWKRELEVEKKRRDIEVARGRSHNVETDRGYDWRDDDEWKRSEGLSPFPSKKSSDGKKKD